MASASNASRVTETSSSAASSAGTGSGSNTRPSVDVTAITTRDDFLLELGEALGGQASVRPVDSMSAALEYLSNAKRGQVLVIDTRDVSDVRADIERAHVQAAHAVVLIFTVAETEKQVGAAVKGSNVFAVLPIPLDRRKTGVVFEGAMADAIARKSMRGPDRNIGVSVESFQSQIDSGPPSGSDGKSKMGLIVGAGIAVVAIAAGAYMFLGKSKEAAAPATAERKVAATPVAPAAQAPSAEEASLAPRPVVETSLVAGKVDELLERARLAMRERRYSEPIGDNALLYYRSAAAADPSNGEVTDGLQRVASVLAVRFDESMNAGHFDEASITLANFKAAAPKDSRTPGLEVRLMTAQISKALADGNLDRANALIRQAQTSSAVSADQVNKWKAETTRRTEDAKVQRVAGLITDRIRDGRLIEPADDSAKMYLQQLHDLVPTNATTQRLTRDLNGAYMRKAREAALGNHAPDVDRWITEAKAGGVGTNEISAFQKELSNARQKAINAESDRLAGLARDRIKDGRLTDPVQDSAAYYINQLQGTDPNNAAIGPLSHDLAAKLVERARASAQAGKGGGVVDGDLNLAKRWGADPKDVLAVQQIQNAPKTGSSAASRSAAASGVNTASLAATLKRTRYVPPEFPSKALSQRVSGAVTVEYTVDSNGDPRDVRIIEATPPGVFDKAAVTAVKRWHYDPVIANGAPVEVPVRTSIR
ncbi:MAG: Protein TonB, partial [Gammaproteobacteria bacterium]|nr:Protein TonB [Gammaproteobacteria bacterium]